MLVFGFDNFLEVDEGLAGVDAFLACEPAIAKP